MTLLYNSFPISSEMDVDSELNRNYTSIYEAYTLKTDSPLQALQCAGIPNYYQFYTWGTDADFNAWITRISAKPKRSEDITDDSGTVAMRQWVVTVNHSTKSTSRNSGVPRSSPIFEPPKVRGSFMEYIEQAFRDRNNKPITNSSFEPLMPPLQKENSHDSLFLSYNTPVISLSQRSEYRNSVNSTSIWGLSRRQVKMKSWNYEVMWDGFFSYIHHELEFLINRTQHPVSCDFPSGVTGWYDSVPNMGFAQIISGKQTPITDGNDKRLKEAAYLNCAGQKEDPTTTNEKWRTFELETEKDFTQIIGLPLTLPGPFI